MKKIIYGATGTGKSYGPIADYIRNHTNIIVVTPSSVEGQLSYAKLQKEAFEKNTIKIYDFCEIPTAKQDEEFVKVINSEEFQKLANNKNNTVIIWGGFVHTLNKEDVAHLLSKLECNVLIEYCCSQMDIEQFGELSNYLQESETWEVCNISTISEKN